MRTKTTLKILSETSEETKEKVRNNANNLINKKMDIKEKMTTQEKALELVQDLGFNHAIYVTEEVIAILEDWEGTELAKKDWIEIKEIIESIENTNNLIENHYQEINDIVHENQGNLGDITNQIYEWFKQFEYDYSKNCECETRIGETWCCNQCGLPTTK